MCMHMPLYMSFHNVYSFVLSLLLVYMVEYVVYLEYSYGEYVKGSNCVYIYVNGT